MLKWPEFNSRKKKDPKYGITISDKPPNGCNSDRHSSTEARHK